MIGLLGSSRGLLLLGGGTLLVAGAVLALRPAPPPAPAPLPPLAQPAAPAPLPQYVVATRDIPRGAPVTADALRLVGMSEAPAPDAPRRVEEVVGRVALRHVGAGQILSPAALSTGPAQAGLGVLVPGGSRAMTLKVVEDTGVAGLVQPGDRVDVLVATQADDEDEPRRGEVPEMARFLLEDVLVLAVGDLLDAAAQPAPAQGQQSRAPRDAQRPVTLAVTPEQALLLGLARGDGGYMLALRNPEDRATAGLPRSLRQQLLSDGTGPEPAARPRPAPRPAPAAPSGPVIIRGPSGAGR